MEAMFQTVDLTVGYAGTPVISGVNLNAAAGRILALIGPNGAGKSTILKTLIRQLAPLGGAVLLDGRELASLRTAEIARSVSAVLTGRPRPELMTCRDVVSAGRYPYTGRLGILSAEDRRVVEESMALVQVSELGDRDFTRISDGQRQRVLLARAICQEPRVLIMDEPTSFLDIRHKLDFLFLLRRLVRERSLAVILSLHELDLAQRFSDTVLCVRSGAVDRVGPPEEIFQGDYIARLYGVEHGSYNVLFGGVEADPLPGPPRVFVIGGGGSGVPVYRKLRRLELPFAAGVLPESDGDYAAASALAAEVIASPAFAPVPADAVDRAAAVLRSCETAVCTLPRFGAENAENQRLLRLARQLGILRTPEELG